MEPAAKPNLLSFDDDRTRRIAIVTVGLVIIAKFVAAAVLPVFYGDESFYWLWSHHLAWGYYDHPPAIALLIRIGTDLFGNTEFGVRFVGVAVTIPMTLCLWRAGTLLLGGSVYGALAALFFNLTLQVNVQTLLAGPDAAVLPCIAAFLWALAEAIASGNGRWWLLVGFFGGLGLLSKYSMAFVGGGTFLWLLIAKEGRVWLRTPWPWLGGLVSLLVFAPHVIWNSQNDWATFAFQLGRIARGSFRWHYLPQFVGEQLLLASPFIMLLAMWGLWRATWSTDQKRLLIACLLWPGIIFFVIHGLHSRVHRVWTDVLYPALALAAVDAIRQQLGPHWLRAAAVPLAATMLAVPYMLLLSRAVPIERFDVHVRQSANGMPAVKEAIALTGARGIVTSDFQTTSWLRFHLPGIPVIQIEDDYRFAYAPQPALADFAGTLIYVGRTDIAVPHLQRAFSDVENLSRALWQRDPSLQGLLYVYRVSGFRLAPYGRMP